MPASAAVPTDTDVLVVGAGPAGAAAAVAAKAAEAAHKAYETARAVSEAAVQDTTGEGPSGSR